jgi:hypothetical protein
MTNICAECGYAKTEKGCETPGCLSSIFMTDEVRQRRKREADEAAERKRVDEIRGRLHVRPSSQHETVSVTRGQKLMNLVIKRSEWIRGQSARGSYLYRQRDDKKCCLGFLGLACGVVAGRMLQQAVPSHILNIESALPPYMAFLLSEDRSTDSAVANELMVINDTTIGEIARVNQYNSAHADFEVTSEDLREAKITEILAAYGFAVTFVD